MKYNQLWPSSSWMPKMSGRGSRKPATPALAIWYLSAEYWTMKCSASVAMTRYIPASRRAGIATASPTAPAAKDDATTTTRNGRSGYSSVSAAAV